MLLYDTSTLGTSNNLITFNDDSTDVYYRLTDERVMNREITDFDQKIPDGMGVTDFQTLMGKTNYLLTGTMYPDDEASYDTGIRSLRKLSSLAIEQDDADSDSGYVPFKFTEYDGYNKQISVKVLYTDVPRRTRNGLKQPFRLFCKIKYPVLEDQSSKSISVGDASSTTTGTSIVPIVVPFVVGGTSYTSNGSITNDGDLDVFPAITIFGPVTSPRITNSTTGEYIELAGLNLSTTANSVVISYDQDTLSIASAGTSQLDKLTSTSTLFKIEPGINNLALTGATLGSGAHATVNIRSAWPLS